jgi:DNA invertase Pin-like site-specific DNA recombinase
MATPALNPAIPAAQYVRMSTERQEYSLANQSQAIAQYAARYGFVVVQTYSDPAISGVLLRRRKGLQKLIQDVVQGQASYRAILVYDVSRWGRFQDTDESAHYEFMCKSAGVPVHYCAEIFVNDDTLPSMIMKSLKRAMAREYSRELGEKVTAGQRRGAMLGFHQGGQPGYGLRRLLVSADRGPKQILDQGERKSIATDRITLVRGTAQEARCIREIYRMFIEKRMTYSQIARELDRRKTKYIDGSHWNPRAVRTILTHPKYVGTNVYGQITQRLYTTPKPQPRSQWTITPGAFEAIVDPETYRKAQLIRERTNTQFPRNRSAEELLDALRAILAKKGRITLKSIKSVHAYRTHFGSLLNAYRLIGYSGYWRDGWLETRRRIQRLRDDLMAEIIRLNPGRVCLEHRGGRYRTRLRMSDGTFISVIAARPFEGYKGDIRWLLLPRADECSLIALVARLNVNCDAFKDMFVLPPVGEAVAVYLKDSDPRLQVDTRLVHLTDFRRNVESIISVESRFPRHLPRRGPYTRRHSA